MGEPKMLRAWASAWVGAALAGLSSLALAGAEDPDTWRQAALDQVRAAMRTGAVESELSKKKERATATWQLSARFYVDGAVQAFEASVGDSLQQASTRVGHRLAESLADTDTTLGRLFLTVKGPSINGALIEYQGKALKIVGDVTSIASVDRARVLAVVREQRDYLLRQIDPVHHGFFKVYSARFDRRQERLRATYTASAIWTLLQMRDVEADQRIDAAIGPAADFLLSMQVTEGPHRGAFHYSFDPATGNKRQRFVVGTVSKTVFTLLELSRRSGDARYLEAAKRAGEWLLTRVQKDGRVLALTSQSPSTGVWTTYTRQSVLYSSEVLSALSRLYGATGDRRYRRGADRIAKLLVAQGEANGFVFGDDFRSPNTISTSWVAMALIDYTAAIPSSSMERALFDAAHQVVLRQHIIQNNLLEDGRYFDTWSTSGNGWMNEVLVPVYQRCIARGRAHCARYREALQRTSRWLVQNTYSPENSYHIPNPERARGGAIRNSKVEAVRTDAVCHAGNSLIGMLNIMATEKAPVSTASTLP